jgi:hypothetical protein
MNALKRIAQNRHNIWVAIAKDMTNKVLWVTPPQMATSGATSIALPSIFPRSEFIQDFRLASSTAKDRGATG